MKAPSTRTFLRASGGVVLGAGNCWRGPGLAVDHRPGTVCETYGLGKEGALIHRSGAPAAGRRRGHRRVLMVSGQHRAGRGPLPAGDGGPGALRRSHGTTHRPRRQRLLGFVPSQRPAIPHGRKAGGETDSILVGDWRCLRTAISLAAIFAAMFEYATISPPAASPPRTPPGWQPHPGHRPQSGSLDGAHRSGRAGGYHQDPAATLLLPGRTPHPQGPPPHPASAPTLALGKPVQSCLVPAESPATAFLTPPSASALSSRPFNRLAVPRQAGHRVSPAAICPTISPSAGLRAVKSLWCSCLDPHPPKSGGVRALQTLRIPSVTSPHASLRWIPRSSWSIRRKRSGRVQNKTPWRV